MTRAELEVVLSSPTISFACACKCLGLGLTAGREALRRGDFPARVIRVGRCIRVPSAGLAELLGLPR